MSDTTVPKIYHIIWHDACSKDEGPWNYDNNHTYEPKIFEQVGYLLAESPDGFVFTHTWSPDGITAIRDQIPRGMVISMTELKVPKRRKST